MTSKTRNSTCNNAAKAECPKDHRPNKCQSPDVYSDDDNDDDGDDGD